MQDLKKFLEDNPPPSKIEEEEVPISIADDQTDISDEDQEDQEVETNDNGSDNLFDDEDDSTSD